MIPIPHNGTKVAVMIFDDCTIKVRIKAIINRIISLINEKRSGNDQFSHLPIFFLIGPTIKTLAILTMLNNEAIRTIMEKIIQKSPVPASPNALTIGTHQYEHPMHWD
jgi:hypothetical protein